MKLLSSLAAVAFGALCLGPASAQDGRDYGSRPIRLIVPVSPGGSTDIVARIIAASLTESAGLRFVIDNRPGAGGVIGAEMVARATPDGYTLLFAYASFTTTPFLQRVPYDPYRDFTHIINIAVSPLLLVVNPSLPVSNVQELIALAKAKPKGLNAGIATAGSAGHIAMEIFKSRTGVGDGIVSVIYSGGAPAQVALMSGEVQLVFGSLSTALPFIKSGKVKLIASIAPKRLALFPDSPTLGELGVALESAAPWQGLSGPPNLPRHIVTKLNGEVAKILKRQDVIDRLLAAGALPVGGTPEAFSEKIRLDLQEFGKVIPSLGMKGER